MARITHRSEWAITLLRKRGVFRQLKIKCPHCGHYRKGNRYTDDRGMQDLLNYLARYGIKRHDGLSSIRRSFTKEARRWLTPQEIDVLLSEHGRKVKCMEYFFHRLLRRRRAQVLWKALGPESNAFTLGKRLSSWSTKDRKPPNILALEKKIMRLLRSRRFLRSSKNNPSPETAHLSDTTQV